MILNYDKSKGWDGFVSALFQEKSRIEQRREQIIRHQTVTAATLIGLIAVFGDVSQSSILLRYLTISSVVFLFLAVLAGVLYSFLYVELEVEALVNCLRQYEEEEENVLGNISHPLNGTLAKVFPWLLCIGILLLSVSVVVALL